MVWVGFGTFGLQRRWKAGPHAEPLQTRRRNRSVPNSDQYISPLISSSHVLLQLLYIDFHRPVQLLIKQQCCTSDSDPRHVLDCNRLKLDRLATVRLVERKIGAFRAGSLSSLQAAVIEHGDSFQPRLFPFRPGFTHTLETERTVSTSFSNISLVLPKSSLKSWILFLECFCHLEEPLRRPCRNWKFLKLSLSLCIEHMVVWNWTDTQSKTATHLSWQEVASDPKIV